MLIESDALTIMDTMNSVFVPMTHIIPRITVLKISPDNNMIALAGQNYYNI